MILHSLLLGLWADPVHTEWWRLRVASRAGEERKNRTGCLLGSERTISPKTGLFITPVTCRDVKQESPQSPLLISATPSLRYCKHRLKIIIINDTHVTMIQSTKLELALS